MKRVIIPAVLILSMVAIPAFSFHGPGGMDCPGHRGDGPGMGGHGGPDVMGLAMHLLHLGETLGLSDQQKTDIEAILDTARPEFEALQEQMESAREEWRDNLDPAVFDETAARNFAESQAAVHVNLMVLGMKTRAQVFNVLTPEQQEQLRQYREDGPHHGADCKGGHGHHKRR